MQDFEKLGAFYLGKAFGLGKKKRKDDLLLYDSRDLVTHAVCVGMTDLDAELQSELAASSASTDPATEKLETLTLRPKKTDITVRKVALVWLPYRGDAPAFG
jgi:hypothetical protein